MPTTSALPDPDRVRQGATLRTLRELRGLTVADLAARVGKTRPYLSNIEAGRKRIPPLLVGPLAAALAVPQIALVSPEPTEDAA